MIAKTNSKWCLVSALAVVACLMTMPARAFACSVESEPKNDHCYAIERWNMQGSPAEVIGAKAEIIVGPSDVPNWSPSGEGGFLDDEMWVDFPQISENSWVEAGATVGWPYGPTEPHYFHAREYSRKNYNEYIYPTGPGIDNRFGEYLWEPYGETGEWCMMWEWETSPNQCWGNFGKSSKELEAGLELATTTASGVYNWTEIQGWQQWTTGSWHESWETPWNHPYAEVTSPLCVEVPAASRGWGSIRAAVGAGDGCY